jgi:hypothetical protein
MVWTCEPLNFAGIGDLVQYQDLAPVGHLRGQDRPKIGPTLQGRGLGKWQAGQLAVELAALQPGRLALGRPIDGGQAGALGPVTGQHGLAHTPPAVEQYQLRGARPGAR